MSERAKEESATLPASEAKKMEKELRRSTATLDEEREKHKQIVIMLMKERKRIITRLLQV